MALDTLVREELGLDPSSWVRHGERPSARSWRSRRAPSCRCFPFSFAPAAEDVATGYVIVSAVLAGIALFGVGASLSLFTGRSAL